MERKTLAIGFWLATTCAVVMTWTNVSGRRIFVLDGDRTRVVPRCSKSNVGVLCKLKYGHKEPPGPRVSFRVLDRTRLLVTDTSVDYGEDEILTEAVFVSKETLDRYGVDYDNLKIFYNPGVSNDLSEVKPDEDMEVVRKQNKK